MASNFSQNSHNIIGWEITPFAPNAVLNQEKDVDHQKMGFSSSQHLDLAVQRENGNGLENGVLMAYPVSVDWPEKVVRPEPAVVEEQRRPRQRRLSSAKIVAISSIYFMFVKRCEDPVEHALVLYDDAESSPQVEEIAAGMNEEDLLPLPALLKEWKMETRERPNGARDKFYSHPTSKRTFRSVIEVVEYIKSKNNLENAEELQGHECVKLSEASSSNKNKRKIIGFHDEFKLKITRSFPGAHGKKTPQQLQLEEFYANAHNNLMNLSPTTPVAMEFQKKSTIEPFLFDAQENLLGGLRNQKNGRQNKEIDENLQNPDPSNLELLNPQEDQNQGFEDQEKGREIQNMDENKSQQIIEEMINELYAIETPYFQPGGINPELTNPHHQGAENLDQPMIEEMINELYRIGFGNPENSEPPNFQQGGNLQLPNPEQAEN